MLAVGARVHVVIVGWIALLVLSACTGMGTPVSETPSSEGVPGRGLPTIQLSTPSPVEVEPPTATPAQPATKRTAEVLHKTPVASSPDVIGSLSVGKQYIGQVSLDDTYIYWVGAANPRAISRYPLAGPGDVEAVAVSRYSDGDLSIYPALRSADWLIFLDSPLSAQGVTWAIRALNMKTGQEQIVAEELHDLASWPGPFLDADGDWVVWTRSQFSQTNDCGETVFAARNLETGEQRELDRVCAETNYMWNIPHISGNNIVVEKDLPDSQGGGNDIYLLDLASGQVRALTDNGRSSMPDISGRWIVWKSGPRFREGRTVVYDIETGDERIIAAGHPDPHVANNRWVYWLSGAKEPIRVYDLQTHRLLTVAEPGVNENLQNVVVYGDMVAWYRDLDFEHAPSNGILEWRNLPSTTEQPAAQPTAVVTATAVFDTDGWVEHRLEEAGAQVSLPPDWTPMRFALAGYLARPNWVKSEIDPAAFALTIGIRGGDTPHDLPGLTETLSLQLSENEPGPLTHEPIILAGHEGVAFRGFAYACMKAFVPINGVIHEVTVSSYLCQGEGVDRQLKPEAQAMLESIRFFPPNPPPPDGLPIGGLP